MKKLTKAALVSLAIGTVAMRVIRVVVGRRKLRQLARTSEHPAYSAISPQTLVANNLIDLNTADIPDLLGLGLEAEAADRIVENRPFRNKMELVARRILPQEVYETIKEKVAIANANEAVKIG